MPRIDMLKFAILWGRTKEQGAGQGWFMVADVNKPRERPMRDFIEHAFSPKTFARAFVLSLMMKVPGLRRRLADKVFPALAHRFARESVNIYSLAKGVIVKVLNELGGEEQLREILGKTLTVGVWYGEDPDLAPVLTPEQTKQAEAILGGGDGQKRPGYDRVIMSMPELTGYGAAAKEEALRMR